MRIIHLLFFLCGIASATSGMAQSHWCVIELDSSDAARESYARAINNAGVSVGDVDSEDFGAKSAIFDYGVATDLGTLGGSGGFAYGVNIHKQVVGTAITGSGENRAFLYTGGQMVDLNSLVSLGGSFTFSQGSAINDSGRITGVGVREFEDYTTRRGFLASGGVSLELPTLEEFPDPLASGGEGLAINAAGVAVGYNTQHPEAAPLAVSYAGIEAKNLNSVGSFGGGRKLAGAHSINLYGDIGGYSLDESGYGRGFLIKDGNLHGVPLPKGYDANWIHSVNSIGEAIGVATRLSSEDGDAKGFLYRRGKLLLADELIDARLGYEFVEVGAINDAGQIAGGVFRGGFTRACQLTPYFKQYEAATEPLVPQNFGYVKADGSVSVTARTGCVLTSLANMCRGLFALDTSHVDERKGLDWSPKLLDELLVEARGYSATNDYMRGGVTRATRRFANLREDLPIEYPEVEEITSQLDADLTDLIYRQGAKVRMKLRSLKFVGGVEIGHSQHQVWVVGKQGTDWIIADPGVNGRGLGDPLAATSLERHLTGYERNGTIYKFKVMSIAPIVNLDYPAVALASGRQSNQNAAQSDGGDPLHKQLTLSGLSNLDVLLTDPLGRRTGKDPDTGIDYKEIPKSNVERNESLEWIEEDSVAQVEATSHQLYVIDPLPGEYSLKMRSNDQSVAEVPTIVIDGLGGASRKVSVAPIVGGQVSEIRSFILPEVSASTDVKIELSNDVVVASAGESSIVNIVVTNAGSVAATNVEVRAILPEEIKLEDFQSQDGECRAYTRVAGCSIATLAPGESSVIQMRVNAQVTGQYVIPMVVSSFEADSTDANNSAVVRLAVTANFQGWRKLHFDDAELLNMELSGPLGDPDGDGVSNLEEYATRTDPRDGAAEEEGAVVIASTESNTTLRYRCAAWMEDVTLSIEVSDDLTRWTALTGQESGKYFLAPNLQVATIDLPAEYLEWPRLFARMRIQLAEDSF